jgi:2-polyprenyl-3-methyl-5-hydroxy-6-metoxy-1,4-benzoquinol methylase
MDGHTSEVAAGQRFEFGKNWGSFLRTLDEDRIERAVRSLRQMLECDDLTGKTFIDVGSGSGLFSLAARRLGARVHSFDFDPQSVGCTRELKRRYFPDDEAWVVENGSALDNSYVRRLGEFDVVYSWGVLHHTGRMWAALENVVDLVAPKGLLFIAIYNDQGTRSLRWTKVKRLYNRLPQSLRFLVVVPSTIALTWRPFVKDLLNGRPLRRFREYRAQRGMSYWHDVIDWVGGYPFEVAKPEQIFDFYKERGFLLTKLTTDSGLGCNQFVFRRVADRTVR